MKVSLFLSFFLSLFLNLISLLVINKENSNNEDYYTSVSQEEH